MKLEVKAFYDKETNTLSYVVFDKDTKDAFVIDPVLNYNQASSILSYESIYELETYLKKESLNVAYIFETHVHADHISGARALKQLLGNDVKIGISHQITKVQKRFKGIFNLSTLDTDGRQFDKLLQDNDEIQIGSIKVKVIATPGHTPACTSFLVDNCLFTGDTLFMPDFGTGRCDFPDGDSANLYDSILNHLYTLPDDTRVFIGHDYQPNGRQLEFETSIGLQKENNVHLKKHTTKEEFTSFRDTRDKGLSVPKLLYPTIQMNIDGAQLPLAEDNGTSYLKIPITIKS